MEKSCWMVSLSYHSKDLNCHKILYSNAADLKRGSSTYVFLLCPFLVSVKSQVLSLRVGRSHDQGPERAYSGLLHTLSSGAPVNLLKLLILDTMIQRFKAIIILKGHHLSNA